jgi:hypothetical protein
MAWGLIAGMGESLSAADVGAFVTLARCLGFY